MAFNTWVKEPSESLSSELTGFTIISASSNPLPSLPLPISPPYANTKHGRTHQECAIPIRNTSIRSRPLFRTPKQLTANRAPKHSAQPPGEKDKCIHSSILADAEDLGDEGREQRIVSTGRDTVEHDESQPEGEGGRRGGCQDAREPEGKDAGCGEEERQDERVLPAEAVASVARQDATHGVDGVACGKEIGAFGGGEAEADRVRGNEGEGQLGPSRLQGLVSVIADTVIPGK